MTEDADFTPAITIFMLVKTKPEWLALSPKERFAELAPIMTSELSERRGSLRMKFYDTEFYNTRVTDVLMFEARDNHSWELFVEHLRETKFWDHYFEIVEILPGVENAYAANYGQVPVNEFA